jgi:hypothetical protein
MRTKMWSEISVSLYFVPYLDCTRIVLKAYRNWLSKERGLVDNCFSLVYPIMVGVQFLMYYAFYEFINLVDS